MTTRSSALHRARRSSGRPKRARKSAEPDARRRAGARSRRAARILAACQRIGHRIHRRAHRRGRAAASATGTRSIDAPTRSARAHHAARDRLKDHRNNPSSHARARWRRATGLRQRAAAAPDAPHRALRQRSAPVMHGALASTSSPARLAPSAPVTAITSPGRAPPSASANREGALRRRRDRNREHRRAHQIAAGDLHAERCAQARHAAVELQHVLAASNSGGTPSATVARRGRAPIAAISLKFAAIARQPISSSDIQAREKCTPSINASVVMTLRCEREGCHTAASSPMPTSTRGRAVPRALRSPSISSSSFTGLRRACASRARSRRDRSCRRYSSP